ncbi:MAG: excinuclease ABC subunit C [Candidatus Melainabacteria bacterium GWF2_32_7]|nr:MAG: excinuclease ABC subunit C [Candidatus Melainabacteria bacterium GWF2_32_7]
MKTNISLKDSLSLLPEAPGVYLMYDQEDEIIYIGKAKSLKKRVKSYFTKNHDSPKLVVMVPQIVRFEFIITDSEIEALILESHMIKKHKPKYNVLLKDDKKFPWFVITSDEYPRIIIARKVEDKNKKDKYFGPYTNSRAMYSTLELIKKLFPLRQCKNPRFKDRPCMYYQIGKCLGPCQILTTAEEYKKVVKQVELFLSGKQVELLAELKSQMEAFSVKQEFEKAAKYRDSYFDVMKVVEKQKVVTDNTSVNQDIIGYDHDNLRMSLVLLKVRDGRLIGKEDFDIKLDQIHSPKEAIIAFIQEYYQMIEKNDIPKEILIQEDQEEENRSLLSEWLSTKKENKVNIITPKLQTKHELVEMAIKNAASHLENLKLSEMSKVQNDWNEIGSYIQEKLNLPKFPYRIECFDISHIQGTNTVASMVVFINGKSFKSEYRRFRIRSTHEGKPDDYAAMREVIKRRYAKLLKDNIDLPELIIVDGGKGQLSAARESLEELGLTDQPIVSLAKKFEEIYLPDESKPVIFPSNSQALFVFQKIRDEAHRFAIAYHRKLRENQAIKSILDEIPQLSLTKKKFLLDHFGDVKNIMTVTESEIARVIGKALARKVYKHLHAAKLN